MITCGSRKKINEDTSAINLKFRLQNGQSDDQHPPFYTVNGQVSQTSAEGERSFSLYFHLDLYSPYNLPNTDEYICWQEMPPQ